MRRFIPSLNLLAICHDTCMAAISFTLAYYLRVGHRLIEDAAPYWLAGMPLFTVILLATLLYYRTYRRVWSYTSLNDLMGILRASALAILCFYPLLYALPLVGLLPRSLPIIHAMTLVACLVTGRVLTRLASDKTAWGRLLGKQIKRVPVLIHGLNERSETFIRESERSVDFPYQVVGVLDEDSRNYRRELHGVRIYGTLADLPHALRKLARKHIAPQRLLLTELDLASRVGTAKQAFILAEAHGLSIARLPALSELKDGHSVGALPPVAVEDILGRPQAQLDLAAMKALVHGQRILITGAGGSIGSELVRQIAADGPAEILLYELSEYALYHIDQYLEESFPTLPRRAVLGDVRNAAQLEQCFTSFKPQLVFHAAAIKHVPLSESNPDQAILANILGSRHVADACVAHGVLAMVQVSTDKAVHPTSLMGATKRAAELYCQSLATQEATTRFITVRFGNVLNSAGSVVPLFQRQIAAGGPITITHPDMMRYFMTIREATQLIRQATVLGMELPQNPAPIFVLDMGGPIRIEDLACQMIRLAGSRPHKDIAITYTGLRAGEKLFEELFYATEKPIPTRHASVQLAAAEPACMDDLAPALERIIAAAQRGEIGILRELLNRIVPEYRPE